MISNGTASPKQVGMAILDAKMTTMPSQTFDPSPFLLSPEGAEILARSDGFNMLRDHLAQHCSYE